jgi:Ser/Thr protein kinase RdoA (MazF antagonist)
VTDRLIDFARRWDAREGTLARIDGATNLVGRFQSDTGTLYVRVTNTSVRSLSLAAGALDWQRHLFNAGAPVAEPLRSSNGCWIETSANESTTFIATATRALPGRAVDFANLTEIDSWAEAVGRVHAASVTYRTSPVSTSAGTIHGELPALGDLWQQIEPAVASDPLLRERYEQGSAYLGGRIEPTLVTHGDVRPENAVASGGRVVLVDFDEPTRAWPPYDLARMMLDDDARPAADPDRHLQAIRDGYRRGRPSATISEDDVAQWLRIRVLLMYAWSLQDSTGSSEAWLHQLRSLLASPLSH